MGRRSTYSGGSAGGHLSAVTTIYIRDSLHAIDKVKGINNLPPALLKIGTADPLIDVTYFMEARWRLADNKTYLATYPESPHGFNFFPTQMAAAANEIICRWIITLCEK